jgi:translation initiation factor IF-2
VDEQKENTGETASASPAAIVTEKRVTRSVIRRRAGAAPLPPVEEAPPAPPEETVAVAPAPEPEPEEAPPPPPEEIVAVEVAPAPEVKEEPPAPVESAGPARPAEPAEPEYLTHYKRIKVVAAPPAPEPPPKRPKPVVTTTTQPGSILAQPGAAGLGRKEIIEIRDFHKLKPGRKKRITPGKKGKKTEITTPRAAKRVIKLTSDAVSVADMARKMSVKAGSLIQRLINMGMMVTINQSIDLDTASLVAAEFGFEVDRVTVGPEDLMAGADKVDAAEAGEDLLPRAPIVTVMGHVDHGKTSILDAIRQTDVASKEAGGITQHIGAYSVKTPNGRMVTFIDTPGHEAFTAMRARGAKVTDVVVLVVAADDGVMPQTKEAVNHARSGNVPIIVAVNKMDKQGADPEKIKKALTEFNMVPEEWGGDTLYIPVSAKTGMGIPQLLEMIALQTEVLELKANPNKLARGTVVEAQLDKRRGPVMTVLVQSGTLKEGDVVVAGTQWGRVRAMADDRGKRIREAGPSAAVEVMGLAGMVAAGDSFVAVDDERKAKEYSEMRQKQARETDMAKSSKVSLEDVYEKIQQGDVKELRVVVKADTSGSVEVLSDTIRKLSTPKVAAQVIHGAVGGISESDIMLASASQAVVVGFNVRPDPSARQLAERQGIDIRLYDVIYTLTEDLSKAMVGLLAPRKVEQFLGRAEVRQVFVISKVGAVAGCGVTEGKILRSSSIRLVRDSVPVCTGRLSSLKRFKDDVREVTIGLECGLSIENFNDIKVGDVIEAFTIEEVAPSLA